MRVLTRLLGSDEISVLKQIMQASSAEMGYKHNLQLKEIEYFSILLGGI